jgi:hypothetical protein
MIYFNVKDKSRKKINNQKTLDSLHNTRFSNILQLKNKIPKLKKELDDITKKFNILKQKEIINLNNDELKNYYLYEKQIKDIEKQITYISNNQEEQSYLLNTGNLIFDYYDNINNDIITSKTNVSDDGIMSFFNKNYNNVNDISNNYYENTNNDNILNENLNKADMLKKYLTITDPNYKGNINFVNKNICNICNSNLLINLVEGISICSNCGEQTYILIDTERPSYKEPPSEYNYFSYKRMNHLSEWLAQFQSKESTDIPNEIIDKILIELKKQRITNIATLSNNKVKEILKKLKLSKYYEHTAYIIHKINGIPPPIIEPAIENKLRAMFREIQNPFLKHCPKNRKNFLSYSYCLHKFFQLLGFDEYIKKFPLLKSREKLFAQDQIWKNICKDLGWEFHRSL